MNIFHENDAVRLCKDVMANVITGGEVFIPRGGEGTVVFVHGDADQPSAYEVEFYIPEQKDFAIATVEQSAVAKI